MKSYVVESTGDADNAVAINRQVWSALSLMKLSHSKLAAFCDSRAVHARASTFYFLPFAATGYTLRRQSVYWRTLVSLRKSTDRKDRHRDLYQNHAWPAPRPALKCVHCSIGGLDHRFYDGEMFHNERKRSTKLRSTYTLGVRACTEFQVAYHQTDELLTLVFSLTWMWTDHRHRLRLERRKLCAMCLRKPFGFDEAHRDVVSYCK